MPLKQILESTCEAKISHQGKGVAQRGGEGFQTGIRLLFTALQFFDPVSGLRGNHAGVAPAPRGTNQNLSNLNRMKVTGQLCQAVQRSQRLQTSNASSAGKVQFG